MKLRGTLTQDRLFELPSMVNVEQLSSTERKDHTLIVFLQLVVDLCSNEGCEFSLGERFILVERLTATVSMDIYDRMEMGRSLEVPTFD